MLLAGTQTAAGRHSTAFYAEAKALRPITSTTIRDRSRVSPGREWSSRNTFGDRNADSTLTRLLFNIVRVRTLSFTFYLSSKTRVPDSLKLISLYLILYCATTCCSQNVWDSIIGKYGRVVSSRWAETDVQENILLTSGLCDYKNGISLVLP